MAPVPRSASRRTPARHHTSTDAEPPLKKLKYVPGGPGGGGRYVDDQGNEIPVGGTGPGGYAYAGPRGPVGRKNLESGMVPTPKPPPAPTSPTATYSRPRRERPPARPRYSSSAAAAAAAATQSDGYKPREERGWEEFHQDLQIDLPFPVFSADEVDGVIGADKPCSPLHASRKDALAIENGRHTAGEDAMAVQPVTPTRRRENSFPQDPDTATTSGKNGDVTSPLRRRPGRPPRRPESMLHGLGSPPAPKIVPLPAHNPKERLNLPRPSYRAVDTWSVFEQDDSVGVNYVNRTLADVGYQESDLFLRGKDDTYIRVAEGLIEEEVDLATGEVADGENATVAMPMGRVEYDMDEQDDRWLEVINAQRKEQLGVEGVTPAQFEITMTLIEKNWSALEKRIPKPNPRPPQTHRPRSSSAAAVNGEPLGGGEEQDTKCAICDDGDCENTNAIVFCDGCDLAVHQECYGVPFIPEGQWLCRKCQLIGRGTPVSSDPDAPLKVALTRGETCLFCPNIDGAFKQTNTSKWAHLLCAIWIPEVSLGNTTFMEPVMDVEKIPKTRWKLQCYICNLRMGACIQCGNKNCFTAFHVTCARKARLFLKMKNSHGTSATMDASVLKAFCHKHVPSEWRRENDVDNAFLDAVDFYRHAYRNQLRDNPQGGSGQAAAGGTGDAAQEDATATPGNKRKRSQPQKIVWRLPSGAPVVPHAVFHNVEHSLVRLNLRKRKEFVYDACKYWTLKREARRGAALLKRLQLQMETFTSMEITRRNFAGMGAAGRPRLQRRIEFAEKLDDEMEYILQLCEKVKERETKKLEDATMLKEIVDSVYFPIPPLLWPILEKAQALDGKGAFRSGFENLQTKLEERHYTSVAPFAADFGAVISSTLNVSRNGDVHDQHIDTSSHSTLTPEQKELKKLAKRIAKAVKDPLKHAVLAEADLGRRPLDDDVKRVDEILEQSLTERKGSVHGSTAGDTIEDDGGERAEAQLNGEAAALCKVNGLANGTHAADDDPDKTPRASPRKKAQRGQQAANDHDAVEAADEAVIRLQLSPSNPSQTVAIGNTDPLPDAYGPASTTTDPDISTEAEADLLAPLSQGGIPWYLTPFDPSGTTVHDERWSGRELLRDESEELSEMDDEEVAGLVDVDEVEDGGQEDGEPGKEEVVRRTKSGKRVKRWRGFR